MQGAPLDQPTVAFQAAIFQAALTGGLSILFGLLFRRYRRPYLGWWSLAWVLYTARLLAIILFLAVNARGWLYLHQVLAGWAALALFGAALTFERGESIPRRAWLLALIPPMVAYLTILVVDSFEWAAGITVVLLAAASAWTGLAFFRFRRRTGSWAAGYLAFVFMFWGAHHLDYPLLRARGLLAPWSFYIDSALILSLSIGVLLLIFEELHRGLRTLSALSGDLHRARDAENGLPYMLERITGLAGITGCGVWYPDPQRQEGRFAFGMGTAESWTGASPARKFADQIREVLKTGIPRLMTNFQGFVGDHPVPVPFIGLIPLRPASAAEGVVVVLGQAREPFTALDQDYWLALGQQIGGALENAELDHRLRERGRDLERLSLRLIQQHEDQRRRLARELHDETAQVFSAMKLQLGLLGEKAGKEAKPHIDRMVQLVDAGIQSIRSVVEDLRPQVLDDLGLPAALQALVTDFQDRAAVPTSYSVTGRMPSIGDDAELALFRALQEALSNVARHAGASRVDVEVACQADGVRLTIADDGRGIGPRDSGDDNRMGLVGMRERFMAIGGRVAIRGRENGGTGTLIEAWVPVEAT